MPKRFHCPQANCMGSTEATTLFMQESNSREAVLVFIGGKLRSALTVSKDKLLRPEFNMLAILLQDHYQSAPGQHTESVVMVSCDDRMVFRDVQEANISRR